MNTKLMIENKEILLDTKILTSYCEMLGLDSNSIDLQKDLSLSFKIETGKTITDTDLSIEQIETILTNLMCEDLIVKYGENWDATN